MEVLRIGRNAPCSCGSGKKYKVCCARRHFAGQFSAMERPQRVFGDEASSRPKPQLRPARSDGDEQPIKRIPIRYTYPAPFGTAECVYCFPVEQPIILANDVVIPAEWLQAEMRFRMQEGVLGTVTAVERPEVWEPPSSVPDKNGRYVRRVLGTIKHKGVAVIDVTFRGQTVTGTPDHLWYSVSRKAWIPAQTLKPGELLLNVQGSVVSVESISELRYGSFERHNLEVEELHTYFVGTGQYDSALVHNGMGDYIKKPADLTPAEKTVATQTAKSIRICATPSRISELRKQKQFAGVCTVKPTRSNLTSSSSKDRLRSSGRSWTSSMVSENLLRSHSMATDLNPENNMTALLEQARRDLQECELLVAESKSLQPQVWQGLAGSELDHILESPEAAARYLKHPEPRLRQAALSVLTKHWQPTPSVMQECERLELQDADPEVRKTARSSLISCYSKLHDPRLAQVFARIVMDESDSLNSRISAYEALFQVRGMPPDTWPGMRMRMGELKFPEDVDWSLVETCMHSGQVA